MAELAHTYTRLPRKLRDELAISRLEYDGVRRSLNGPRKRKEHRKAARVERKSKHAPIKRRVPESILPIKTRAQTIESTSTSAKPLKSILKAPKKQTSPTPPRYASPMIARQVKKKLSEEDAEIVALEKALGIKNSSNLPKSFEVDGLDGLLEGLDDDAIASGTVLGKRQKPEGHEWLENKRRKAQAAVESEKSSSDRDRVEDSSEEDDQDWKESQGSETDDEEREWQDDASFDGFYEDESVSENATDLEPSKAARRPRENPYVAPPTASNDIAPARYVPPSLRNRESSQTEALFRLRKQVQGLLNRLSEANMLSIVGDIEKLYLTNPRQDVSTTILDMLIGLLSDPSTLQDTFLILHAGLIAALCRTIGTEFGAQAIQRIDAEFSQHYERNSKDGVIDKRLTNLIKLIADLYNFQVIGSVLIYDLIRQFLSEVSETNTELILKIVRSAGSQLRQDDQSSLKAIIRSLQQQIAGVGEESVSTKIKFMMETMNDLKNNRMKTGIAASSVTLEHLVRMKKTLGTLNQKRVKASEPLRISLKDLRESDRRGRWWLIGSSYKDEDQEAVIQEAANRREDDDDADAASFHQDINSDLLQLAKEHRMNTSVRQSIFIAIMSATDYNDAYIRLTKLRLKKSQELEIPKVLIYCCKSEEIYNPYYTLLARKICSDRKLKMAFQFSLWDLFKQLDRAEDHQGLDNESEEDDNDDTKLSLRAIVNLARTFGALIADGGLGLGVLKNLTLAYLQPSAQTFVEILLTTVILQSGKAATAAAADETSCEKALTGVFTAPKEMPEMARGLHYFIKKHVSRTDVMDDKRDREVLKWGCRVASTALKGVMSKTMYEA